MAREKKQYPDDDGRTIADMSGIERQPFLLPRLKKRRPNDPDTSEETQHPEVQLSKEERRSYMFGAMGASLLIAAVFVVVFAIVIFIMLQFWH